MDRIESDIEKRRRWPSWPWMIKPKIIAQRDDSRPQNMRAGRPVRRPVVSYRLLQERKQAEPVRDVCCGSALAAIRDRSDRDELIGAAATHQQHHRIAVAQFRQLAVERIDATDRRGADSQHHVARA